MARRGDEGMADLDVTPSQATTTLGEPIVTAINQVLAEERGSLLALVQLSAMATEALERHALVVAGGQAAQACIDLHALLVRYGAPVSDRVGDAADAVLELDRIDDRYLAFDQVQRHMMAVIESLPAPALDPQAQAALAMTHTLQAAHAEWALQRARDFAASREEAPTAQQEPAMLADGGAAPTEPGSVTAADAPSDQVLEPGDDRMAAADIGGAPTATDPSRGAALITDEPDAGPLDGDSSGS
jgi:hypothetical protein